MKNLGVIIFEKNLRIHDNKMIIDALEENDSILGLFLESNFKSNIQKEFIYKSVIELTKKLKEISISLYIVEKTILEVIEFLKNEYKEYNVKIYFNNEYFKTIADAFFTLRFYSPLLFPKIDREYKICKSFFLFHIKNSHIEKPIQESSKINLKKTFGLIKIKNKDFIVPENSINQDETRLLFLPGESAALESWYHFRKTKIYQYHEKRDFFDDSNTSMLSLYINSGQISLNLIWHECIDEINDPGVAKFLQEIGWREFAYHTYQFNRNFLLHNLNQNIQIRYENNETFFYAWKNGTTGFDIVDCAMRQLKQEGWIHNRLRMIVASFLTKNLLIDWRWGAAYFMETLIDGDEIVNTLNWQWVAGVGIDSAPYFRIFNPEIQAKKFDSLNIYQTSWRNKKKIAKIIDLKISRQNALLAKKNKYY